jgi:hypothetical protein
VDPNAIPRRCLRSNARLPEVGEPVRVSGLQFLSTFASCRLSVVLRFTLTQFAMAHTMMR